MSTEKKSNFFEHTFVIPAFRQSPFLEECIISLKKQSLSSNIIITTSTPSVFLETIASKYKIPLIVNDYCEGIASDWTFALMNANTKFVTLAHQDDIYLPEYTQMCLAAVKQHKGDPILVFTDYDELYNEKIVRFNINLFIKRIILLGYILKPCIHSGIFKKLFLSFGCVIPCPCVMYNKKLIGNFKFSNDFLVSLDWDTWLKMSKIKGSFIYVNKRLVRHRIHKHSQTLIQTKNYRRKFEDKKIFQQLWPEPISSILAKLYRISSLLIESRMKKN